MKNIIIISLLLLMNTCSGQKTKNNLNTDKMKYYNENEYKDWKQSNEYSSSEDDKNLMKGDERVRIMIYTNEKREKIIVEKSNIISPYKYKYVYSYKSKILLVAIKEFYQTPVGKSYQYDETGKIIKETDYDKDYKFSIKDLVEKIKKEYSVDIENKVHGTSAGRKEKDGIYYYEVSLKSKENDLKRDYILIDGNTGETLYKSYYYMKGKGENPFDKYINNLNKEKKSSSIYQKKKTPR